ncbi:MAG: lectin-like domain-containing protein [Limisphaerales bacterium]
MKKSTRCLTSNLKREPVAALRSKTMMKKHFVFATLLLAMLALTSNLFAGVIFSDDFESGTLTNWTGSFSLTDRAWTISTVTNIVPTNGIYSALITNSGSKMHRNIINDNGGVEVSGHAIYTAYIYDDGGVSLGSSNLTWVEVRAYTGTGFPNGGTAADGGLQQLIAIGKSSSAFSYLAGDPFDPTKYQGRSIAGTLAGGGTWFNLNDPGAPSRSVGWHKFQIEQMEDGTTLKFYVDGVLSRTILGNSVFSWDTIMGGAGQGGGSTNFNVSNYLDGISLTTIADTNKPTVRIAYGSFTSNEVNVVFSEGVSDTAISPANYSLSGGLTISSVDRTSMSSVRLNTSTQTSGANYTLTVNNVQDLATNIQDTAGANTIATNTTATFVAFAPPAFYANFNDGLLPVNTTNYGNAFISGSGGVGGTPMLDLTDATANQNGSFIIQDLSAGQVVGSFTASFRVRMGGGSTAPAEGFSFNLAGNLPDGTFPLDGGGSGLSIIFDTFNGGTDASSSRAPEAPAIDIRVGTNFVAHTNVGRLLRTGADFVDVLIKADLDGKLSVVFNGSLVYSNLVVYTNKIGGRFGFGGLTGGSFETHYIDDLGISVVGLSDTTRPTIASVSGTGPDGCSSLTGATVAFSESVGPSAEVAGNYALSGGISVSSVTRISPSTVVLNTSLQNPGSNYTVTVNNVQDTAVVPNTITPTSTAFYTSYTGSTAKFYSEFCSLPTNAFVFGNAIVDQGVLKLTTAANSQGGTFIIDDLDAGKAVTGFTAMFKVRVGGGSGTGADGFSFNFAGDLPNDFGEEGAGTGLTISFDTYDNGGNEAPAIDVRFGGVEVAHTLVNYIRTGSAFVDMSVHVDTDGTLALVYGTNVVYTNLLVYTTPIAGRFGFGARTGGVTDNHWIDNLRIDTIVSCPPLSIIKQGSDVVISWSGISTCVLQSSTNVAGPYTDQVGATSPFTTPITGSQKFFRLRGN